MKDQVPFRDQPIPPYADMVIRAIKEQPNIKKITLSKLSDTLKSMGLKDAYRKVQELPRTSPCRVDGETIIEVYAQTENASASTKDAVEGNFKHKNLNLEAGQERVTSQDISATFNPNERRNIVKTASYSKLEKLLGGIIPLNIFIDGDSGLGKSMAVIDLMKKKNKEVIRFNCSFATDTDDFLGGYRLIDGQTIYFDGPVIIAQERGACLLLDELDACDPKILFELQSVLEGNGVLLKKVGRMSYPKPGFQVIATGNTKGSGDLTGDFSGTNVLNKSFLDRFDASMTWAAPTDKEMKKILQRNSNLPEPVVDCYVGWYAKILENYESGVVPTILGTRRIQSIADIAENMGVTKVSDNGVKDAADFGTNRFHEEVKGAFLELLDRMIGEELEKTIQPGKKYTFDEIQKKEFIKNIKGAWRRKRDKAADIGTLVHEFLAGVAAGKAPELPVNKKAAKACEEVLFWYQETITKPIAAEAKVYSREYNYAGTLDLDAETIHGRAIVDWKTGNKVKKYGIRPEYLGQTAGYQHARQEEGYGPYDLRIIVRIDRDTGDMAVHEAWNFERDFESFKAALTLGRFVNAVKGE